MKLILKNSSLLFQTNNTVQPVEVQLTWTQDKVKNYWNDTALTDSAGYKVAQVNVEAGVNYLITTKAVGSIRAYIYVGGTHTGNNRIVFPTENVDASGVEYIRTSFTPDANGILYINAPASYNAKLEYLPDE